MDFCLAAFVLLIAIFCPVKSKVYDRCELATELRDIYEFPANQLATWICIANYESHFNTSAHNPGSGDHGLFQISELFWCSPGMDLACAVSCSDLKDDDIEDDVICAKRIFRQHQRISGNGFTAWVVYNLYCNNKDHADKFLNGCFTKKNLKVSVTTAAIASSAEKNEILKKIATTTTNSKITKTTSKPKSTVLPTGKPAELSSSTEGLSKLMASQHSLSNKISTTPDSTKTHKTTTVSSKPSKPSTSTTPVHRLKLATFSSTHSSQQHSLPIKISTTSASPKTPKIVAVSAEVKPSTSTTPVHRLKLATFSSTQATSKPTANKIATTTTRFSTSSATKNSQSTVKLQKTTVTTALPTKREDKRENRDFYEKNFSNLISSDTNVNIKPRETKGNDYAFVNHNEHLYAVINRSDYQFTLTSRGFRFSRS